MFPNYEWNFSGLKFLKGIKRSLSFKLFKSQSSFKIFIQSFNDFLKIFAVSLW